MLLSMSFALAHEILTTLKELAIIIIIPTLADGKTEA